MYTELGACRLCPRECGANRNAGETGFCKASDKIKIARAALHMWEEPCVSGENGSGTVFFSHCTMKCVYCQNYRLSAENKGYEITEDELSDIFLDLQNQGAHNINLVTPTHYVPQIITALRSAKKQGLIIPIVYNTSGWERIETLKTLEGLIDIYMPDMKYFSDARAQKYSSARGYFQIASKAVEEMTRQTGKCVFDENGIMRKGVIVRHLMLPGMMSETRKIMEYLYKTYGNDIYISLMSQYTPMPQVERFPEINRRLNMTQYNAMVEYCAELGMENVYIQDGEAASESFIPPFETQKNRTPKL